MTPDQIVRTARDILGDAVARLRIDDGRGYSDPYWEGRADAIRELLHAIGVAD